MKEPLRRHPLQALKNKFKKMKNQPAKSDLEALEDVNYKPQNLSTDVLQFPYAYNTRPVKLCVYDTVFCSSEATVGSLLRSDQLYESVHVDPSYMGSFACSEADKQHDNGSLVLLQSSASLSTANSSNPENQYCQCEFCKRLALELSTTLTIANGDASDNTRMGSMEFCRVSEFSDSDAKQNKTFTKSKPSFLESNFAIQHQCAGTDTLSEYSPHEAPVKQLLEASTNTTEELFGEGVELVTQSSIQNTSTPQEKDRKIQPYAKMVLMRLLAESSPSTATSAFSSLNASPFQSPLLHNTPNSTGSPGSDGAVPINPIFEPLVSSQVISTDTSDVSCVQSSLNQGTVPSHDSSYKSSLIPSSTESSFSEVRTCSIVLSPPPGFGPREFFCTRCPWLKTPMKPLRRSVAFKVPKLNSQLAQDFGKL